VEVATSELKRELPSNRDSWFNLLIACAEGLRSQSQCMPLIA